MIRINLAGKSVPFIPGADAAGVEIESGYEDTRKEAMKRILIILVFPALLYAYENQNLPGIRRDLQTRTDELNKLIEFNSKSTASVAEIKKIREDEAKIQSRIAVLDGVSKERQTEIRILDLFQQIVPEKMWFTKVVVSGNRVNISGMAVGAAEVSNFMESLSRSIFFADVNLLSSSEQVIEGATTQSFEISCAIEKKSGAEL